MSRLSQETGFSEICLKLHVLNFKLSYYRVSQKKSMFKYSSRSRRNEKYLILSKLIINWKSLALNLVLGLRFCILEANLKYKC